MNDLQTLDINFDELDTTGAESYATETAKGLPEMSASCSCGCHNSCEVVIIIVVPE